MFDRPLAKLKCEHVFLQKTNNDNRKSDAKHVLVLMFIKHFGPGFFLTKNISCLIYIPFILMGIEDSANVCLYGSSLV